MLMLCDTSIMKKMYEYHGKSNTNPEKSVVKVYVAALFHVKICLRRCTAVCSCDVMKTAAIYFSWHQLKHKTPEFHARSIKLF